MQETLMTTFNHVPTEQVPPDAMLPSRLRAPGGDQPADELAPMLTQNLSERDFLANWSELLRQGLNTRLHWPLVWPRLVELLGSSRASVRARAATLLGRDASRCPESVSAIVDALAGAVRDEPDGTAWNRMIRAVAVLRCAPSVDDRWADPSDVDGWTCSRAFRAGSRLWPRL